ncbi:MAG: response regulator [Verrucomicrobia bacterium]|nr:response regulator [Verrucomicrobiota bacterium]
MADKNSAVSNKHVLVVDDDIALALTFQEYLQAFGYRVSTAVDGAQALKQVLHGNVDAILCDLNLPELTGDLFYAEVGRAHPHLLKRFIFVTGNANDPIYTTFLKTVKAPLLTKPVSCDHLLEKLKSLFSTEAAPSE